MTDHLPILTELDLSATPAAGKAMHNFREVEWDKFNKVLDKHLTREHTPENIINQQQLDDCCNKLIEAI
jgi:hypothetical protein